MRDVLSEAERRQEGLRRLFDDQARWPANPATLNALVRHGLLARETSHTRRGVKVTIWRITDIGREALNPPEIIRADQPIYMARGSVRFRLLPDNRWAVADSENSSDYTSDPSRSIDTVKHPTTGKTTALEVLVGPTSIESYTRQARKRERERREQNGRALDTHPLTERLNLARQVALDRGVDISDDARLIRHMLATGREDHALARLVQLEARLGQRAA